MWMEDKIYITKDYLGNIEMWDEKPHRTSQRTWSIDNIVDKYIIQLSAMPFNTKRIILEEKFKHLKWTDEPYETSVSDLVIFIEIKRLTRHKWLIGGIISILVSLLTIYCII